jgi:hypothetical protein
MAKTKPKPLSKREAREEIDRLMKEFLKKGGKIKTAPKARQKIDRTFFKTTKRTRKGAKG